MPTIFASCMACSFVLNCVGRKVAQKGGAPAFIDRRDLLGWVFIGHPGGLCVN